MTARVRGYVVTCDEEWVAHGREAELPADVFTLAEAKAVALAHAKKMGPRHASVRIWKYDQSYRVRLAR